MDKIISGLLVAILVVLLFCSAILANLSQKFDKLAVIAQDLVDLSEAQAETQVESIKGIMAVAILTGVFEAAEKSRKGWYEALSKVDVKDVPIEYPQGWSDRYFNYLAREGTIRQLHEVRGAKGGRQK